jgi:hypothetical protein
MERHVTILKKQNSEQRIKFIIVLILVGSGANCFAGLPTVY